VVEARDAQGRPVAGATVTWISLTQSGTVSPAQSTTGADGRAQAMGTLGQAGENRFQASASFGSPVVFVAQAAAPGFLTLEIVSGNNQQDIVDRVLAQPLVVRVRGSGVPGVGGVTVTWAAVSGGGSVTPLSATTAADGTAQTSAKLGRMAGAQRFSASVAGAANSPVFYDATGLAGPAAKLVAISGDGQRAVVGSALPQPLVVETRDAFDNPKGGVPVDFASLDSGAVSPSQAVTGAGGANGRAQATGTLGARAGTQRFTASAANLAGSPQTFVATALAGFAQALEKVSGDGQTGTVGTQLGAPLVVRVVDGNGNPVPGVQVTFAGSGGGSMTPATASTDANGAAQALATLGTAAGAYTFTASAQVAAGSPQGFTATAVAGPAATLAIASGDGQSAPAGAVLPQPLRALVTDRYGNPVAGTAVGFASAGGGGSVSPASAMSGADGAAATTATLGPLAGANEFTASAPGLTGSPVTFRATGTNTVTEVQVTPFTLTMAKGVSRQFVATAIYSDRTTANVTAQAQWSTSAAAVATVAGGLVTAVARGSASISASFGGRTGVASVTVTEPRLLRIEVTPVNSTVPMGATRPFVATGVFDDGSTQPLTASATWSSSNPAVLAVSDAAGSKGQATGVAAGTAEARASFGGLTGAVSVRVTGGVITQVEILPPGPSTQLGVPRQLNAVATFDDGSILNVTAVATWASASAGIATVSTAGLVTPVATGTVDITATYGGVTGRTQFIVEPATLVSIAVLPPQQQVPAGLGQPFQAFGVYSDGTSQNITGIAAWSSSNTAVAVVSNSPPGIATGVSPGTAIINAARGNVSGSATLRVTDAQLLRLRIQPDEQTAPPNVTLQFQLIGDFTNRSNENLTPLGVWSTSRTNVAVASNAAGEKGRVTTLAAGDTEVRASYGGMSAAARLRVAPAVLTHITVTPSAPTVGVNETARFFATGTFTLEGRTAQFDITGFATWFSSNPGVATVSNVVKGLATGQNPGTVTVTATFNGVSGSTSLTVKALALTLLVIAPANPVAPLQQRRLQFFATGVYEDGSRSDLTQEAQWSTSDPLVAVFPLDPGQEGNAFFLERGSCTVTARVGSIRATTTLTVR
jgi:hypothetical protein